MDEQIRQKLPSLSPSEQRVGEWLVTHLALATDASIAEIASAAGVSQPTVVRFCRSMDTSGFREFRKHLIAALQRPDSYFHHDVDSGDDAAGAATKVVESSIRALVDLRPAMQTMPFAAAVRVMRSARQIVLAGFGASGHVVEDARHKFFRLGIPCVAATDALTIAQQAAIACGDDVFVVVSHTGKWPELVAAMRVARSRGATVIALTDPQSPLAAQASLDFSSHSNEDTGVFTPMTSRLVHLTLLDALQVALALAMGAAAEENLRLAKLALAQPDNSHEDSE